MKTYQPTGLGRSIVGFFQEYLPTLRGMSRYTIQSYRDGLVLFLQFAATTDCGRAIESLEVADITADRVGRFLAFLESARQNSITTRNARLAALHTFSRSLVAGNPDHMAALQRVLGIPFKRGARAAPIEYLEKAEIEVLLASIDRSTLSGQRDYAMFSLMFNTGARIQEILNLRVRDVRLESLFQVRLAGKDNKMRVCPIWPRSAQLLKDLIQKQHAGAESPADQPIFLNERGATMTRFGVRACPSRSSTASALPWRPTAPNSSVTSPPVVLWLQPLGCEGIIDNWWRHGMMGGAKAHYDCIKAFSETDFTEDLKKIDVPVLVMHGDDDQIVPTAGSARLSSRSIPACPTAWRQPTPTSSTRTCWLSSGRRVFANGVD
jgi:integrase/recombinase XerD